MHINDRVVVLTDEAIRLRREKDQAYAERNKLVHFLAKLVLAGGGEAVIGRHDPEDHDWEDDWQSVVYIQLPTGQVSWHIHDSELPLFADIPRDDTVVWDGHSTPEKYERLEAFEVPLQGFELESPDAEELDAVDLPKEAS